MKLTELRVRWKLKESYIHTDISCPQGTMRLSVVALDTRLKEIAHLQSLVLTAVNCCLLRDDSMFLGCKKIFSTK